ncbi:MAG: type IV pilus modification PilV family protein [Pseudomonadota bacterium]
MRTPPGRSCHCSQKGATLLEALIAILIFSLGILGLVALQAVSIKNVTDAGFRADAAFLANQIISQMWADNPANLAAYAHRPNGGNCAPAGANSGNGNVATWLAAVNAALPGAISDRQQIQVGAGNLITVTICWQGPQDAQPRSFVTSAQING